MLRISLSLVALIIAGGVSAEENPKFTVADDRLIFDTETIEDMPEAEIRPQDVDDLRAILRDNSAITTLVLNSNGGQVWAADKMSDIVIDFGLDTHVDGDCDSSCVTVFLAGDKRTMARGSRLGFHQYFWSAGSVESYYDRHRDSRNWETPFDFASWMYNDIQSEVHERLSYMVARGVDPGFAIQTLRRPDGDMWRPYRSVLRAAGVLTD